MNLSNSKDEIKANNDQINQLKSKIDRIKKNILVSLIYLVCRPKMNRFRWIRV